VVKIISVGTTSISKDRDIIEEGVSNVDSRLLTIYVAELIIDSIKIYLLVILIRDSVTITKTSNE
jgi:hypothetical protein